MMAKTVSVVQGAVVVECTVMGKGPFTNYVTSKGGEGVFTMVTNWSRGEGGRLQFGHVTKLFFIWNFIFWWHLYKIIDKRKKMLNFHK